MKIKDKFIIPVLITLSLGLSFSSNSVVKAENSNPTVTTKLNYSGGDVIQKLNPEASVDWTKGVVKVTGAGAPPDRGNNAQKRLMAIRAAKADAFRQLLEAINGVHVSSETIVKDFVTESDVIKTQVEGLIKGAELVGEPKYMSDGSVEVEMQVKLYGKESVASVILPQEIKQDTKVVPSTITTSPSEDTYTSLILDCKGLGVQPAMSPAIFDSDNGEIYVGNIPIDPDYVINEGIVSYASSMTEAKKLERAGDNPIVLKASKIKGLFKSDVFVTNDVAKSLIGADGKGQFLKNFKVIMVI